MGHKSSCRSLILTRVGFGILLIIGACGPSDMPRKARARTPSNKVNAGCSLPQPELVLGVKKEAPPPPPARRSATDIDNSGVLLRAGRSVLLLRGNFDQHGAE